MEQQLTTIPIDKNAKQVERGDIENELFSSDAEKDKVSSDSDSLYVPKKPGRRPKSLSTKEAEQHLPRRESKRLRKSRQLLDYSQPTREKSRWSTKDKQQLLRGLDRLGEENVRGIIDQYLPQRSESDVKTQIKVWKQYASQELGKKIASEERIRPNANKVMVTKLNEWIEYFKLIDMEMACSSQFSLSNTLLLIAEYGKFPPLSECQGVDFRALYRALHCMMNGMPYYGLNQATAKILNQSIAQLLNQTGKRSYSDYYVSHLMKSTPRRRAANNYGRPPFRGQIVVPSTSKDLLQMPGMNPLNLPVAALKPPKHSGEECKSEEEDSSLEVIISENE